MFRLCPWHFRKPDKRLRSHLITRTQRDWGVGGMLRHIRLFLKRVEAAGGHESPPQVTEGVTRRKHL